MKIVTCPDCSARVRPCNLERHRLSHLPLAVETHWGTRWLRAKRPLPAYSTHDHRYDEHIPRGFGKHRFRIYRMRASNLELLGSSPTAGDFGEALFCLYEQGEFITDDTRGVLDTAVEPGAWIVHPFALGRRPANG